MSASVTLHVLMNSWQQFVLPWYVFNLFTQQYWKMENEISEIDSVFRCIILEIVW